MCCTDVINKGLPDLRKIMNESWVVNLRNNLNKKKGSLIMRLFGKSKIISELKEDLRNAIHRIQSLEYYIKNINNEHEISNMINQKYPSKRLNKFRDAYEKDREEIESKGFTLQGCVGNEEIWVNKGVKNG